MKAGTYIREIAPQEFMDADGGIDESPTSYSRFDAPIQLETRGVTEQTTQADRDQFPEWQQALIWNKHTIHKNTVAAKLREGGRPEVAAKLEKCHTQYTIAQCTKCHTVQKFPNRCDQYFCPECQPRLSNERRRAVEWWTREVKQPKHVVLTVQNVPNITKAHVLEFKKWWKNLRRSKFCRNWHGGFYSIEVTNEGRGWHLHLHALVNAHWIDTTGLSINWNRANNGLGRIVKVKDARKHDYLKEVTKYAVKGVQLAAWPKELICEFLDAFTGVRTFGVFGDLYAKRTEFAEWFKAIRDLKPTCKCGCCDVLYFSEAAFLEKDFVPTPDAASIPPPPINDHPEFSNLVAVLPPR
jgi:hypothetical protein